jgi:hypothetical protein
MDRAFRAFRPHLEKTLCAAIVDRIPALLGARHSAVPPIELRLAAVDEAEAVGETNGIGSVHFADRSQ